MTALPAFLTEITITDSNKWIDWEYGAVERNTSIATGLYDDIREVLAALETAMSAVDNTTITLSSTGKITISNDNQDDIALLWNTGTNAANSIGEILGFDTSADDDGGPGVYEYTSDYQHQHGWYSRTGIKFDSKPREEVPGAETFVAADGTTSATTWNSGDRQLRQIDLQLIEPEYFFADEATLNEDFETWWRECREGSHFKLYLDAADFTGAAVDAALSSDEGKWSLLTKRNEDLLNGVPRHSNALERYSKVLRMQKQALTTDPT